MSYDLTMLEVREGETVESALERAEESNRPAAEGDRVRRETIAALLEHDPKLDVHETARYTELTSLDEAWPVQVTVYGDQASITIPYWHSGDAASTALAAVWQLVEIIHDRTGWILYDHQLDGQVDIAAGPGRLLGDYEHGTSFLDEVAAEVLGSEAERGQRRRKRFWLF
jgi:hypothetical protein